MLRVLHRIALTQQIPDFVDQEFDKTLIDQLAQALSPEDVQLFYQIGLVGQRDLPLAPDPRSGFEMAVLRMLVFKPGAATQQMAPPSRPPLAVQTQVAPSAAPIAETPAPVRRESAPQTEPAAATPPAQRAIPSSETAGDWPAIIAALNIGGRTRELANNCILAGIDDHVCRLLIDPGFQRVGTIAEEKLREALQKYFGRPLKLEITPQLTEQMTPALEMQKAREDRQQAAVDAINDDPNVQALKDHFGARILPGSIEPLN